MSSQLDGWVRNLCDSQDKTCTWYATRRRRWGRSRSEQRLLFRPRCSTSRFLKIWLGEICRSTYRLLRFNTYSFSYIPALFLARSQTHIRIIVATMSTITWHALIPFNVLMGPSGRTTNARIRSHMRVEEGRLKYFPRKHDNRSSSSFTRSQVCSI